VRNRDRVLDRVRDDATDDAIERYPFEAPAPATVEARLRLPAWIASHDQGREGSCVGHGVALERAIANGAQLRAAGATRVVLRYNPISLWNAAKAVDEWSFTQPGDRNGTSVRAAYQIAQERGLERVRRMDVVAGVPTPAGASGFQLEHGVAAYRWARTVDAIRAAIAAGAPVTIGVDWHTGFDDPVRRGREWWLPEPENAGSVRGGHCVALVGASDRRQAVLVGNSWGKDYPRAWMPYRTLERLVVVRRGEAALVTDR
jgi:hypothetical protein